MRDETPTVSDTISATKLTESWNQQRSLEQLRDFIAGKIGRINDFETI